MVEKIASLELIEKGDIFNRNLALQLDESDPLRTFKDQFHIPKGKDSNSVIYLCGNSLGLQPKSSRQNILNELDKWALDGVEGHFKGEKPWVSYDDNGRDTLANLVGAKMIEVGTGLSLTSFLHFMLVAFYNPSLQRHKILIDGKTFPSDYYAICSQIEFHGFKPKDSILEVQPNKDWKIDEEEIIKLIEDEGHEIALILFSGVHYYSGQVFNLERIARVGKEKGCVVGLDLAHAVGNIPLRLHDWNIDFAVWCSYKYLNSGPGAIGGYFIHENSAPKNRFAGWWGQDANTRFSMTHDFHPMKGADGYRLSNVNILSHAALYSSLEVFKKAGVQRVFDKSNIMNLYFLKLIRTVLPMVQVITPEPSGCQKSLRFKTDVGPILAKLEEMNFICDKREPDVIRASPVPLYNSFSDIYDFVFCLKEILE